MPADRSTTQRTKSASSLSSFGDLRQSERRRRFGGMKSALQLPIREIRTSAISAVIQIRMRCFPVGTCSAACPALLASGSWRAKTAHHVQCVAPMGLSREFTSAEPWMDSERNVRLTSYLVIRHSSADDADSQWAWCILLVYVGFWALRVPRTSLI